MLTRPVTGPDDILSTYEKKAAGFARLRDQSLFERPMLRELCRHAPGPRLLDLGCGTGQPLGGWLATHGFRVTGIDGSAEMVRHFNRDQTGARALRADMRNLRLGRQFDAILAWNSFFHLSHAAQAAMFDVFRRHAAPRAVLVFSSGPAFGTAIGEVDGAPVFHASFSPLQYRRMLRGAGFRVLGFFPEDKGVNGHTWWLCQRA